MTPGPFPQPADQRAAGETECTSAADIIHGEYNRVKTTTPLKKPSSGRKINHGDTESTEICKRLLPFSPPLLSVSSVSPWFFSELKP